MGEREDLEARARDIARAIGGLSPPEQLRLAADLLEHQQADTAYQIVRKISDELGIVLVAKLRLEVNRG